MDTNSMTIAVRHNSITRATPAPRQVEEMDLGDLEYNGFVLANVRLTFWPRQAHDEYPVSLQYNPLRSRLEISKKLPPISIVPQSNGRYMLDVSGFLLPTESFDDITEVLEAGTYFCGKINQTVLEHY